MTWTHTNGWTLPATPKRVFDALTDPADLTRWFAERVAVGAAVGALYRFWGRHTLDDHGETGARQRITAWAPGEALAFSWPLYGVDTEVRYALAADAADAADGAQNDATRLTLTHTVGGDLSMPRPRELIEDHWRLAFGNLIAHLEGGAEVMLLDYGDPAPEVRITMTIEAPVDVVFRALIEPARLARWIGTPDAVVEPWVGGRYEFGWQPYQVDGRDVIGGPTRILELVPNERLVLDWPDWRGDPSVNGQTITFQLQPAGDGATTLTFVHAGFGRTADIGDYPFGWQGFLGQLRAEATRDVEANA